MQDLLPFKETKSGKIGDVFSVKEIQVQKHRILNN
jgi:hypothetical protein